MRKLYGIDKDGNKTIDIVIGLEVYRIFVYTSAYSLAEVSYDNEHEKLRFLDTAKTHNVRARIRNAACNVNDEHLKEYLAAMYDWESVKTLQRLQFIPYIFNEQEFLNTKRKVQWHKNTQ